MNANRSLWMKLAVVAVIAVPVATFASGPRPFGGRLFSRMPSQTRETLQALRSFHEALLELAGEDKVEAKADADVIRTQAIRYAVTVDSILTSEQKTHILDSLGELRRMKPEDRRNAIRQVFSGVDETALKNALAAVKSATPADRPSAVESAVQVVVDGISPALDEMYGITKAQRHALDAARTSFFTGTHSARVDLSVMTADNRKAAFESLSESDQQTLTDAKARLEEKIAEILSR
ncbi:MAG: hypothetical protein HYR85_05280 [Planctomycetes bacterium]|nr:hypothetical protein [Planctomycetota bacterium]MBI3846156.1 hypothetical protein [Planctomycetota bacterium]